jgi:hypothetical protein
MMLAKIAAILMIIWFFQTAKEQQQNPYKWVLIGLIGYWLVWWIVTLGVANPLLNTTKSTSVLLLGAIRHLPAAAAIIAAILVRKKLLADLLKTP